MTKAEFRRSGEIAVKEAIERIRRSSPVIPSAQQMTIHDWLSVFVVDGCNRALDKQGGPFVRVAEKAICNTLIGLLDEAKERFPILGVPMESLDLKEILRALLPVLKLVASKTNTPYDNWFVTFVEQFANSSTATTPAQVMAAMPPPPK